MIVFDIEGDGLKPTKIYCLSYWKDGVIKSITDYDEMRDLLLSEDVLVGHKIKTFDIPVLERILDIKIKAETIDTLGLCWYLYPERVKSGLAVWGEEFGVPKPKIEDWIHDPEKMSKEEFETYIQENVKEEG